LKGPNEGELARAHVVIQQYNRRFPPMEGLQKGTIFPELYMPYEKMTKETVKRDSWRSFGRGGRNG